MVATYFVTCDWLVLALERGTLAKNRTIWLQSPGRGTMVAIGSVICDWLVLALKGGELAKSGCAGYTVGW